MGQVSDPLSRANWISEEQEHTDKEPQTFQQMMLERWGTLPGFLTPYLESSMQLPTTR